MSSLLSTKTIRKPLALTRASGWSRTLTTTRTLLHHAILEVLYNQITNSLTDPTQVYMLRWIAGKQASLPEFDPPYRLVE